MRLRLKTYQVGHEILLWKYDSAIVTGAPVEFSDLLLGCLVCAQEFDQAEKVLNSWRAAFFCRLWRMAVGKKMDLAAELWKFKSYRDEACWFPDPKIPDSARGLGSPWPIRLLAELMSRFGMSETEAMRAPMRKATALYCARAEMANELELFTEQDESNFKKARELMARANADPKGWDF